MGRRCFNKQTDHAVDMKMQHRTFVSYVNSRIINAIVPGDANNVIFSEGGLGTGWHRRRGLDCLCPGKPLGGSG